MLNDCWIKGKINNISQNYEIINEEDPENVIYPSFLKYFSILGKRKLNIFLEKFNPFIKMLF
jgi:hypothetical protein